MTPHLVLAICLQSINHKLYCTLLCVLVIIFPFTSIPHMKELAKNCLRMYENEKYQHYNISPLIVREHHERTKRIKEKINFYEL